MGTRIELHQFGPAAPDALLAARRAIEAVDDALTIHRPSATTAVNDRLIVGEAAVTDDRGSGRVEAALPVAFDFGGFGKGFALDRAAAAMRAAGVTSAFLSAGESSVAVIGDHPLGGAWPLAIPHPLDPDAWLVELSLRDEALSVSSTIGAGAAAPGRRPTVRPSDGTIVTAATTAVAVDTSGAAAEAVSTALLVAGSAAGRLIGADPGCRFTFDFADASGRTAAQLEDR